MIVFPNCKINIGLFVTEKRADGYHNIESLFIPVGWCDVLEVNHADHSSIRLNVSGAQISDDPENNIVVKAYRLMHREFGIPGVNVHLWKRLPMGAGLGGGSADGAFMLKALNSIFELDINESRLESLAAQLGSDCPFFIRNRIRYVSGRGEQMQDMDMDLSELYVMIIHPGIHVGTAEAYRLLTPGKSMFDLRKLSATPKEEWKNRVVNDFEKPVAAIHPVIRDIGNAMLNAGAFFSSMSGSGSAVYGLFSEKPNEHSVLEQLSLPTSALWYTGKFRPAGK